MLKPGEALGERFGHLIEVGPIKANVSSQTEQVKLYPLLTRFFRTIGVPGFHPTDITRTKRTFVANTHFPLGDQVNRVMGMPVLPSVKIRGKIRLNQKRFAAAQNARWRCRAPMRVMETLPGQIVGFDMLCVSHASWISHAVV